MRLFRFSTLLALIPAIVLVVAETFLSSGARAQEPCPELQHEGTLLDCHWAEIAHSESFFEELDKKAPSLRKDIRGDSRLRKVKALWGRSLNYDEYAKGIIVDPRILDSLASLMMVPAREERVVHAGMEHTYGYLFSVLETPFGFKRARWVQGELTQGFGLPKGTISPFPSKGTLFGNVSLLAGKIAFRDRERELKILKKAGLHAPKELSRLDVSKLQIKRITETLVIPGGRTVTFRTDLVEFPVKPSGKGNTHALVYSLVDSTTDAGQLITIFPVETSFVEKALDPLALGNGQPIITRYNAFVEGVTGANPPLTGNRRVEKK